MAIEIGNVTKPAAQSKAKTTRRRQVRRVIPREQQETVTAQVKKVIKNSKNAGRNARNNGEKQIGVVLLGMPFGFRIPDVEAFLKSMDVVSQTHVRPLLRPSRGSDSKFLSNRSFVVTFNITDRATMDFVMQKAHELAIDGASPTVRLASPEEIKYACDPNDTTRLHDTRFTKIANKFETPNRFTIVIADTITSVASGKKRSAKKTAAK